MSEATYKVIEVLDFRHWKEDDPKKHTVYWDFRAEGVEPICNVGRKPGNDLQVGEEFVATSTEDRGKLKLKKVNPNHGNGGGGQQDKPWPRQPEHPENAAAMRRCHSQEMAIGTLSLAAALGVAEKVAPGVTDVQGLVKTIKTLADSYDADVELAVANAALSEDDAARRSEQSW